MWVMLIMLACFTAASPAPGGELGAVDLPEGAPYWSLDVLPSIDAAVEHGQFELDVVPDFPRYGHGTVAHVKIDLPQGIRLESGPTDTSFAVENERYRFWELKIHASREGQYRIPYGLVIDRANGDRELGRFVAEINAFNGKTPSGRSRMISAEWVSKGIRYAYRGRYMVVLDNDEPNVERIDQPPKLLRQVAGRCRTCEPGQKKVVRLIVTVSRDGRVRWPHRDWRTNAPPDSESFAEAQEVVQHWLYRPARSGGHPAATWQVADVELSSGGN